MGNKKNVITIRVSDDIYEKLVDMATLKNEKVATFARRIIEEFIDDIDQEKGSLKTIEDSLYKLINILSINTRYQLSWDALIGSKLVFLSNSLCPIPTGLNKEEKLKAIEERKQEDNKRRDRLEEQVIGLYAEALKSNDEEGTIWGKLAIEDNKENIDITDN